MKQSPFSWRYVVDNFYDRHFSNNKLKYFFQCMIATVSIMIMLVFLNSLSNAVVIASIGSTSFVAFAMPHRECARTRYLVGSYAIGILVGTLCYFAALSVQLPQWGFMVQTYDEVFGAVAVGLTMFLMLIFNLEHAPAASLALGLVFQEWSPRTVIVTMLAIFLIVFFRRILRNYLIDLI